ncbi:oxygen-independent coproporphyrinogen III oxidase [Cellvibrio sp.]|uniref:oxygen-independent coproporphyrinogen III oxidase n=1 Tax=Cellvibrio sp. TaxID=1965322 RepID=UPI0039647D64
MALFSQPLQWDSELIKKYDLAGPRYTSYPTAPQFHDGFSDADFQSAVTRSNQSARPLSLYIHIPFCEALCYYCGCNKVVTNNKSRALPYLQAVEKEMEATAKLFDSERVVKQLHWGGGTPTFISDDEMSQLMSATRKYFNLLDGDEAEYSIEVHPGKVTSNTMAHLRKLGFNRVSMGVQDFDADVQLAVNRFNSREEVERLIKDLRKQEYHSISMDLIYGLPKQTLNSVRETLAQVIDLSPDRLSLFNYAHMPHLFKSQELIIASDLPSPMQKLELLHMAIEQLQTAGYVYIGMDHFAKPSDSLVIAQQQGKLQRNFQGYSTHGDCDLLAFGASSISAFGDVYIQNAKNVNDYQMRIHQQGQARIRGLHLTRDDLIRKEAINQLICHFELNLNTLSDQFGINAPHYFSDELSSLVPLAEDGLIKIEQNKIKVLDAGRLLIRRICMAFDAYLKSGEQVRYSKVI